MIGNHFEYKNRFPKEFSHFNLNNTSYFSKNKPFMSDDLLHTLLPLAGIITKDYEKTRDLFNENHNDKRPRKPCDGKVYPMNK
ncbi:hypothetical protein [Helicobacter pylori]|uniref:hypothetical protein n=1 Tax=Helicobacter pylori TaxID=210 RepID=UPI00034BE167|nr:hypothetical protein [Helicobacter pylori]